VLLAIAGWEHLMSPLTNCWLVEVVSVEVVVEGVFLHKMKMLVAVVVEVVLPDMMRKVAEGVVVVVGVQTLMTIKAFLHLIKTTKLE